MRKRPEPDREGKQAARTWAKRRPLSEHRLKHDGSTKGQREQRLHPDASPWVPA